MKKNLYITLFFFFASYNFAHAYTFSKDLYVGSEGEDVYQLQKILNSNLQTQITKSGIGSPGNETNFFGEKTKQAVIAFQNLYKKEILTPQSLSSGTGNVDIYTRNILNTLTEQKNSLVTPENTSTILPNFFVSQTKIKSGTTLFVGGNNAIKNEYTFYLGDTKLQKKCRTEYTCELSTKGIKTGEYILKSTPDLGEYTISLLSTKEKTPYITTKSLSLTKENKIKGKNFSEKMKVYTSFGVFETDTKNNSFILEFPTTYTQYATSTIKGIFYVENSNGLTSEIKTMRYEI